MSALTKPLNILPVLRQRSSTVRKSKPIELNLGPEPMQFTGASYVSNFALPNFFFHVTTAYNILRANGVVIGKRDFLGKM